MAGGSSGDYSVLYADSPPTTAIRLGQLYVQTGAGPNWLQVCTSLAPLTYSPVAMASAIPAAANPTASVGLTAVNGVALTFMRSDAAPALDVSIAPVWTGIHTYSSALPQVRYNETDQAAGGVAWRLRINAGVFSFEATSDDYSTTTTRWMAVTRTAGTATITDIEHGNATSNPTFTFLGTGAILKTGNNAPANCDYSFISDPNTGMYRIGADQLGFATAGSLRFSITAAGSATFAAGSATADSWPKFTAGTLLTTAEDGTWELDADCLYFCTDAGNRGIIPVEHMIRADATRTFTSNTLQQAIFTTPANGTLTLETGTYLFEGLIAMTTMSATSGNGKFSLIGAGTATLAAILWQADGYDAAAEAVAGATGGGFHVIATQTAVDIVTATIATELCFRVRGTFEVSGAGTIIPSFAQTTAAAAVVRIGSFMLFRRIGSQSATSVGQWT